MCEPYPLYQAVLEYVQVCICARTNSYDLQLADRYRIRETAINREMLRRDIARLVYAKAMSIYTSTLGYKDGFWTNLMQGTRPCSRCLRHHHDRQAAEMRS